MPVRTVSPAEASRLQQRGASIVDVRTPMEFASVHAVGATSAPLDRLDAQALATSFQATTELPLLVICKSGGRSAQACETLAAAGLKDVVSVDGGTDAWERAGLPVERSAIKTMSLERQVRLIAGLLVLVGVLLGWFVSSYWFALPAFIGAGLAFAGLTDWCGMGLLLAKMPWNRRATTPR
jgi:rhodanese-related sulfurtransferase